jgi:hypothetical protein
MITYIVKEVQQKRISTFTVSKENRLNLVGGAA